MRMEPLLATHAPQQTLFIEQVPAAIAMFDSEMRYLAVSRRYLSDLALLFSTAVFAPAEVIGRSFHEISPNMPQRWHAIHARVMAGVSGHVRECSSGYLTPRPRPQVASGEQGTVPHCRLAV